MRAHRLILSAVSALLVATGLVLTSSAPAQACSCVMAGTRAHVAWADVVFTGTLRDRIPPPDAPVMSSTDPARHVFEVDRVYAGDVGATVEVLSAVSGASCGLEGMEEGTAYVVYATEEKRDQLWASLCGGTGPATDHERRRLEAYAGRGHPPVAASGPAGSPGAGMPDSSIGIEERDGSPAWVWGAAGLSVLAGAAGLIALRRRQAGA